LPQPRKGIPRTREMEEREAAEIIFQIYRAMKESEKPVSGEKGPSNWVMSERLKMLEEQSKE